MKFIVKPEVFEILPTACFGVVVARGIDNKRKNKKIDALLNANIEEIRQRLADADIRQIPEISIYRKAFQSLGYNPNKFMCSIEALIKRILKGGAFPRINAVVDLGNAISLKYILPMGAHDLQASSDDIEIRQATADDTFTPFGASEPEPVDSGELVYARGNSVKTRKWIWRQSANGMITEETTDVFFPIDGFLGENDDAIRSAQNELAEYLEKILGCQVLVGWVDRNCSEIDLA